MKTEIEVQQREDIRQDLAERMKFVPPDSESVFTGKKITEKFRQEVNLENG